MNSPRNVFVTVYESRIKSKKKNMKYDHVFLDMFPLSQVIYYNI